MVRLHVRKSLKISLIISSGNTVVRTLLMKKKIFKHHLESTIVYEAHMINENIKTTYYVTT